MRLHLLVRLRHFKAELLTPGKFDELLPAWSPDGSQIAFFSKRTGDPDRNNENGLYVIALNSEQMYQALRSTGVDTQLIIYPGQFHGLSKPGYLLDRMQRYVG